MSEILKKIVGFISESYRIPIDKIKPESRIAHDLKIYGDDAEYLFRFLIEEYKIDISDFKFDEYFPSEGGLNLAFHIKYFREKKFKSLTISDLISAIDRGKLP